MTMSFFAIIKIVYFLANAALLARLWLSLSGTGAWRIALCLVAAAAALAYPALRFFAPEGNGLAVRAIDFIGTFWLSIMLYALFFWLLAGIFAALNQYFGWFPALAHWPHARHAGLAFVAGGALIVSLLGYANTQAPVVRKLSFTAPPGALSHPVRIAALSDTHLGRLVSPAYFDGLVDKMLPFKPDLVLFAGDILDDYEGYDAAAVKKSLARLAPPLGVWGVLGNHEYIAGNAKKSLELLGASGIRILHDQAAPAGELLLIGRDDASASRFAGRKRLPIADILKNAPTKKGLRILLDHQPWHLEDAQNNGIFLQLSGHTHKGQLWPFNFVVDALYECAYGLCQKGGTHYFVSSGAGTWGPRVRTSGRAEILEITLEPAPPKQGAAAQQPAG
jgi:predicted MPP superfamily phosphohydrolase